jgi:hypothetical protein
MLYEFECMDVYIFCFIFDQNSQILTLNSKWQINKIKESIGLLGLLGEALRASQVLIGEYKIAPYHFIFLVSCAD